MLAVVERWQGRLDEQGEAWLRVIFEAELMAAGCAVDMQRTLTCAIGLHSGEVGVAERIQSLSVPGQILVSQATVEALGEMARLRGRLRLTLPGLGEHTLYDLAGVGELALPDE